MINSISGYSRLKYVFRHGINYVNQDYFLKNLKNPIIGNIHKDILNIIINEYPNNKKQNIQQTQLTFIKLAQQLDGLGKIKIDTTFKGFKSFYNNTLFKIKAYIPIKKIEKDISKELKQTIPNLKKCKISYLATGSFGNTFRLRLYNKNNKKITNDKVIKIYKKYQKKINNIDYNFLTRMHGAFAEANITEFIRYSSGHKLNYKDGIILPHMFYLGKTKFCISDYVSKEMKSEKSFKFERLGLKYVDQRIQNFINNICIDLGGVRPYKTLTYIAKYQKNNLFEQIFQSVLIGDKNNLHIIKDFFKTNENKRIDFLNKLLETTIKSNDKSINKRKIEKAINEIKNNFSFFYKGELK